MRNILYISYDGLTDPLGQSQILAYLKRLSHLGNRIVILSFEKADRFEQYGSQVNEMVNEHNLTWEPMTYTKRPPILSTVFDISRGYSRCKKLHRKYNFQIVHCRGYVPAVIGKKLKSRYGIRFIFDMRGWWPDEKLESGLWDKKIYKPVYNYFKKLERGFFRSCDFVVSLTYRGKEEIERQEMAGGDKIGVIPTCVDFEIFKPCDHMIRQEMRKKLGAREEEKIFVYSGSLGGNYDPQTLIGVFNAFRSLYPESFLLILSKDKFDQDLVGLFASAGINRLAVYNVPFTEVTNYLCAGDVGFIYYRISFSAIGRSPTKLGEYWASGLPVISFRGIGDLEIILEKYPGSGILLKEKPEHWHAELKELQFTDKHKLREYASDYFHINRGVSFYQKIYESLANSNEGSNGLALPIKKVQENN